MALKRINKVSYHRQRVCEDFRIEIRVDFGRLPSEAEIRFEQSQAQKYLDSGLETLPSRANSTKPENLTQCDRNVQ